MLQAHCLLLIALLVHASVACAAEAVTFPEVEAGAPMFFPRDHGAHPEFRTEWWYITGWIESGETTRGFQITFFRSRPGVQENNASKFAPTQLIFAHAAIADAKHDRLHHDQRVARAGFGLAYATAGDTDVAIDDWRLVRTADAYRADIAGDGLRMNLRFVPKQPVLLQGMNGYSRKGPQRKQASYYYSLPHLQVSGKVTVGGETSEVRGKAWLDHEWATEYLPPGARGWDWVSINLDDGGAIMAFRMRTSDAGVLWAGGVIRDANGRRTALSPEQVGFEPLRHWTSTRTGIQYPVAMRVVAGNREIELEPLMDDQELDSSASTGVIYWEGAVRAKVNGKVVGRGYLELTGYGDRPEM